MTEIYYICLLVGAGLLAAGFFLGHGHGIEHDHDLLSHEGFFSEVLQFLNLRNLTFFATFFGLAGTVFSYLEGNFLFTLFASLFAGIFSAGFSHKLVKYLKGSESGEELHEHSLAGHRAKVVVDMSREQRGKISIDVNGRILQLPARAAENSSHEKISPGTSVIIVEVSGGTAFVIEEDFGS